jgi:hypothetical protein
VISADVIAEWAQKYGAKTAVLVGPGREGVIATHLERAGVDVIAHVKDGGAGELPACDLLVFHHAIEARGAWRETLAASAKRAAKLVIVVSANPRRLARFLGGGPDASHEVCATEALAPALWDAGRVREHVYLGAPDRVPAKLASRFATEHVFVVDRVPRTPQAKRRLQTA